MCVCVVGFCVISSATHYVKKECSMETKEKISLTFNQNQLCCLTIGDKRNDDKIFKFKLQSYGGFALHV